MIRMARLVLVGVLLTTTQLSACSMKANRSAPASTATTSAPSPLPPPSPPRGDGALGGTSLPARWWVWSESMPGGRNPVDDATGAACAQSQPADVWFLAGTHGGSATRTCSLPIGRPIYFPVINQICTLTSGQSAAAAISGCTAKADKARATLDGAPLPVNEATSGSDFAITAAPGSRSLSAGAHRAVAWGLWVGPMALVKGRHTVTILGTAGTFSNSVTYSLTVT